MTHSVERGLKEAWRNMLSVMGGGLFAAMIYLGFVTIGPGIEGKFFPVITNYKLENMRAVQNGGFSFRASFTKKRDCTYYGVTWFAQDAKGNLTRIQLARSDSPGPPITGPTGQRLGDRVTLYPPAGSLFIFGLNHHECGTPWQTRTMVGPFPVINGRPQPTAIDEGTE